MIGLLKNKLKQIKPLVYNSVKVNFNSSTGTSSNTSDTDADNDTKRKYNNNNSNKILNSQKDIELHDISIIKSLNFKKYFQINNETHRKVIDEEEIKFEDYRNILEESIKNTEGTENKINKFLDAIHDGIFIKYSIKTLKSLFPNEDYKKYSPDFLQKNNEDTKLTLKQFKHLLFYLNISRAHDDILKINLYRPLVVNYIIDYLKYPKENEEKIKLKDFIILMKLNYIPNLDSLYTFISTGLGSIFRQSYNSTTYDIFVNNNKDYKNLSKCLPLFLEYYSKTLFIYQLKFIDTINNIVDTIINLKNIHNTDLDTNISYLLYTISTLNKTDITVKSKIKNLDKLINYLEEAYYQIELESPENLEMYIKLTSEYLLMVKDLKYDFLSSEVFLTKLGMILEKFNRTNISRNSLFLLFHRYFDFIVNKLEKYDLDTYENISEKNTKIILNIYERWDKNKTMSNDINLLYSIVLFKCLMNLTMSKKNRIIFTNNIERLNKDFNKCLEGINLPRVLIDFLDTSKKYISHDDKNLILYKIYNKLSLLMNEDFHNLNDSLATLFTIDPSRKHIIMSFKSDYMNKLYFAYLSGNLFVGRLNLEDLLENLSRFTHQHLIKEGLSLEKKNSYVNVDDFNQVNSEGIEEIQQGTHTISNEDIAKILNEIYMTLLKDKSKFFNIAKNKLFLENLTNLTFNSVKRDYLFTTYFTPVIYPLIVINFRMITNTQSAMILFNFLNFVGTKLSYVRESEVIMKFTLNMMAKSLYLAFKLTDDSIKQKEYILTSLNKFYQVYIFNPSAYEQVHLANKKHQFLKYILRKRFILGRALNEDGPVRVSKSKDKMPVEKTNELTDNYFFG